MIQAKCITKFRDKNNIITKYRLVDLSGNVVDADAFSLKQAIKDCKIAVSNLTLTSDNRLIEVHEIIDRKHKLMFINSMIYIDMNILYSKEHYIEELQNMCMAIGINFEVNNMNENKYIVNIAKQAYNKFSKDRMAISILINSKIDIYFENKQKFSRLLSNSNKTSSNILTALKTISDYIERLYTNNICSIDTLTRFNNFLLDIEGNNI